QSLIGGRLPTNKGKPSKPYAKCIFSYPDNSERKRFLTMARKPTPNQIYENGQGPSKSDIKCPSWLPKRARTAFKDLRQLFSKMGVLTPADRTALIMICDAWDEFMEARRIIENEGMFYTTTT